MVTRLPQHAYQPEQRASHDKHGNEWRYDDEKLRGGLVRVRHPPGNHPCCTKGEGDAPQEHEDYEETIPRRSHLDSIIRTSNVEIVNSEGESRSSGRVRSTVMTVARAALFPAVRLM